MGWDALGRSEEISPHGCPRIRQKSHRGRAWGGRLKLLTRSVVCLLCGSDAPPYKIFFGCCASARQSFCVPEVSRCFRENNRRRQTDAVKTALAKRDCFGCRYLFCTKLSVTARSIPEALFPLFRAFDRRPVRLFFRTFRMTGLMLAENSKLRAGGCLLWQAFRRGSVLFRHECSCGAVYAVGFHRRL